jgi:CheY-like chemotaxis protein
MVLEVDEIVGAVELLIKPLCRSFADHPLILGAAVGADSEILPVVDIPSVFQLAAQGAVAPRAPVAEAAAPRGPRRVLVVDDSVTMRNLERDILQGAGYEVTLAEDGVLGLAAAKEQGPFDLVLTDLQMPRLDGIGLAAALRAQGQRTLPVLMVTTVDDAPTRARAMEAGVDRYLIKRELTRDRLVGLVEELVGRGAA